MKVVNFWKNSKSKAKPKLSSNFISLSRYPKRTQKENRLIDRNPFGDTDKDRLMNFFDCKPMNRKKKGWAHRGTTFPRERTTYVKMMKPDKFIRTTYRENLNYEKIPYETEKRPKIYDKGLTSQREFESWALRRDNIERIKKAIKSRKERVPIPFLEYDEQGRPIGHEGRHRAIAARELGIKLIPVTIARRLNQAREFAHRTHRKDWKNIIENEDEVISSKSADVPLQEQRRYGKETPEALKYTRPKYVTLYHGTSRRNIKSIKKQGLLPANQLPNVQQSTYDSPEDTVMLTADKSFAYVYDRGAVFKVKVPASQVKGINLRKEKSIVELNRVPPEQLTQLEVDGKGYKKFRQKVRRDYAEAQAGIGYEEGREKPEALQKYDIDYPESPRYEQESNEGQELNDEFGATEIPYEEEIYDEKELEEK